MTDFKTIPHLAREWGVCAEKLRAFMRRNPELISLAITIGASRAYTPAAAAQIKRAFDASPADRRYKTPSAAAS